MKVGAVGYKFSDWEKMSPVFSATRCKTGKLGGRASSLLKGLDVITSSASSPSVAGCPLDLYPPLLVCILRLKGPLGSSNPIYGGPAGTLSAIQILSFL